MTHSFSMVFLFFSDDFYETGYIFKAWTDILIQQKGDEISFESLDATVVDELFDDNNALAIASKGISSNFQSAKFFDIKLVSKFPLTNSLLDIILTA